MFGSMALPPAPVGRPGQRERFIVIGLLVAVGILLTLIKIVRLNDSHGDDALFLQLTHNAGLYGTGSSQLAATIIDYAGRGLSDKDAAWVAADPLTPTPRSDLDEFRIHSYFILLPIGLLARVVPGQVLLEGLFVTSFFGLVMLAYFSGRMRGLGPFAAVVFCALIVWHPAWADGLEWEFYPDRLFVLCGFALMLAASTPQTNRVLLTVLAVLCAAINERAAAIGGIFLVAHAALFWRATGSRRVFDCALGALMMVYAFVILHWYLDTGSVIHRAYGSFFPATPAALFAYLSDPETLHAVSLFAFANAALLVLAAFEPRAAAIAVLIMLPNLLGTYSGAEKTGWYTHYHDLYLPALVWAALTGLVEAQRRRKEQPLSRAVPVITALLFAGVFFYDPPSGRFTGNAYTNAFVHRLPAEAQLYLGPYGALLRAGAERVRAAVPAGAMISSVEGGMPIISQGRTVEFYPLGLERADYVLVGRGIIDGRETLVGFATRRGRTEQARIDAILARRLKRAGFDLDHPEVETVNSLALFKRQAVPPN